MLLILRCWQWAVTREGRMRRRKESEMRGGGTNSRAGENRYEVYMCVRVLCAYVSVCGCVVMNVQCRFICSGWGRATAVNSVSMWGGNKKASTPGYWLFKLLLTKHRDRKLPQCQRYFYCFNYYLLISQSWTNYRSHQRRLEINYWCFMFSCQSLSCTLFFTSHNEKDLQTDLTIKCKSYQLPLQKTQRQVSEQLPVAITQLQHLNCLMGFHRYNYHARELLWHAIFPYVFLSLHVKIK